LLKAIKNMPRRAASRSRAKRSRQGSLGIIDVESIQYFVDKLRDSHIQTRLSAVSVLRTAVPHTTAGLMMALDDVEPQVRREAATALAASGPAGLEGLM